MPSHGLSTADHPTCSPLRFVKRGHSRSVAVTCNVDKEYDVFDRNASTDSESDSDESFEHAETYSSQQASCYSSSSLFSTDIDRSHWSITSKSSMLECMDDDDRMDYVVTETDCCNDELHAHDRTTRYKRRVNFALELERVIEIPSHRSLDPAVKEDLYTSMRVIQAAAMRNRKEWDFELRNVQNVAEEFAFIPDCNGNLWHPAHWNPVI